MGRYDKRAFTVGDWFLCQRGTSPAWYRGKYNPETRSTERYSLGTADEGLAKQALLDWYLKNERDAVQTATATLGDIFSTYEQNHAIKLRSYKTVQILLRYWIDYWGGRADLSEVKSVSKQEAFQAHLFDQGLAHNSVNRVLEIGRAAINRAWKRGMVDAAPFIHTLPAIEAAPKGRPLSVDELTKLYVNSADHIRLFIVLMLGTAARNEAITTLAWPQIDFDAELVQLNPDGRRQTSKRRPTVRLLPSVKAALEPLDRRTPAVLMFRGEKVIKVRKGWDRAVERAELDGAVTPYSCRHTAAKWMRKEGVSPWDTAAQLGHRMQGFSMTEQYAKFSPDYLAAPASALEKLIGTALPLDAPKVPSGR